MKNFDLDVESKSVTIAVNPKIYPLEVVYSAAYVFLDKVYVIIDGDPNEEILVQLKAKDENSNLENLAQDFNNELVNYAVYVVQAARSSGIRQAIVERALKTFDDSPSGVTAPESIDADEDVFDDPLGISKPWTPDSAKGLDLPDELKEDFEKKDVCSDE